jgi:hypothetical protein
LKAIFKITVAALFCFLGLTSCDTTDCISFSTRVVIVDFLDSVNETPVIMDFELITAIDSDVIFYGDTSTSTLYLPVNTNNYNTAFLLYNSDNTIDTLEVGYDKTERLISEDCGFEFQFKNIKIIYTTFKNAFSLENELSRLNEENIKIFL